MLGFGRPNANQTFDMDTFIQAADASDRKPKQSAEHCLTAFDDRPKEESDFATQ